MDAQRRIVVGGPHFEDLNVGDVFQAPGLTLTSGHAAVHQALTGDRLALALDGELCREVTGSQRLLAHPNLVCDVAIGQSTEPSQRVLGNLFYRGLVLQAPVFIGDTLRTRTEIVALRQNRNRPGRAATGVAVLRVTTHNQRGEQVLDFWRCPMLPLRHPEGQTGRADDFSAIPEELGEQTLMRAVPSGWRLAVLAQRAGGPSFADLAEGCVWVIQGRESVTAAPELVRLTLNIAQAHIDPQAGARGRRLVYGGHTISVAAAHTTRALPALATILAWERCDHLGPVLEGDILRTELELEAKRPLEQGGGLVHLRARVFAQRDAEEPESDPESAVLDWRFVGLMA